MDTECIFFLSGTGTLIDFTLCTSESVLLQHVPREALTAVRARRVDASVVADVALVNLALIHVLHVNKTPHSILPIPLRADGEGFFRVRIVWHCTRNNCCKRFRVFRCALFCRAEQTKWITTPYTVSYNHSFNDFLQKNKTHKIYEVGETFMTWKIDPTGQPKEMFLITHKEEWVLKNISVRREPSFLLACRSQTKWVRPNFQQARWFTGKERCAMPSRQADTRSRRITVRRLNKAIKSTISFSRVGEGSCSRSSFTTESLKQMAHHLFKPLPVSLCEFVEATYSYEVSCSDLHI